MIKEHGTVKRRNRNQYERFVFDDRNSRFDEFHNRPWYFRWAVVGGALLLWTVVFNLLFFGWLFL